MDNFTVSLEFFCFQALFVPSVGQNPTHQYLYLEVDRASIVEETLRQIRKIEAIDLRKPLKVKQNTVGAA
jgi:hypothetical protein